MLEHIKLKKLILFNKKSRSKFEKCLRLRFVVRILNIELNDSYKYFLLHCESVCVRKMYIAFPLHILNSFFNRQSNYTAFLHSREHDRLNKKLSTLKLKKRATLSRILPIKFYCSVPPKNIPNKYKSKLRSSYSCSQNVSMSPTKYSFHFNHTPCISLFLLNSPRSFFIYFFSHCFISNSKKRMVH